MSLLKINNCTLSFGGLVAVSRFNLTLDKGELVSLIGPNGAGKTTVFNLMTGIYAPDCGEILFEGRSLTELRPHQICRRGIARTFQNIRLFPRMSVLDNVRVAHYIYLNRGLSWVVFRTPSFATEESRITVEAMRILKEVGLDHEAQEYAQNLSYGAQRRLEIARALATRPKILLLDEPAAGMNPSEKEDLLQFVDQVHSKTNLTILLIEHDMKLVMKISQRIVVMNNGEVIAEGKPDQIQNNPKVIEAYLGG